MPTDYNDLTDFESIFSNSDLSPAERERLKRIAAGISRKSGLAAVGALATDPGLNRFGGVLEQGARDDRVQFGTRFRDELEYKQALAAANAKSVKDAEDRDFRERQQAALEEYRRDSLGQQAARIGIAREAAGRAGQLSAYQQQKLADAERARQAAEKARLNAGVQKYGADMAGLSDLQVAIGDVEKVIQPYRKSGDLPGVGGMSNAPGFLGTIAAKAEGGSDVRNALAPVKNIILKARSGGAVTPQEGERLLTEFGQAMGSDDKDFFTAWDKFTSRNRAILGALANQYGDEVLTEYARREKDRAALTSGATVQPQQGRNRGSY